MAANIKFINSLFVKQLLENKYRQTEVVVKMHSIYSESGYVHRLTIRYTSAQNSDATLQLIALVRSALPQTDEATKEWLLLKDILPRFVDIARKFEPTVQFVPRLIHSSADPSEVLIIEDALSNDFVRPTHSEGLDMQHSLVAIEKLATLHAASAVYFAESPGALQKNTFGQASLLTDSPAGRNFFREALACFIANAESMKMPGSAVQKLKALQPRLLAKSAADYAATLNGFSVLNHGNVWRNNLLFKYRNTEPVDARLIDFKGAFIGSPVVDLMFFLTTSVAYDVTRNYKDELLYAYHTKLADTLAAVQFAGYVPSLLELHLDFLKRGIFELMLTLTVAPYLRSVDCLVQPKLVQPFVNSQDVELAAIAERVLATHAEDIIEELDVVEYNGLLDWGAESSNLKKLLMGFQ